MLYVEVWQIVAAVMKLSYFLALVQQGLHLNSHWGVVRLRATSHSVGQILKVY